ncbi:MAG: response regulator transcription factor, partial [Cyanobacteria bacterium J06627_28]
LFVEDEPKNASFVQVGLKEQGFVVDYCDHCDIAYEKALGNEYDVILLTARNELDDRLQGLNLGADDYIAKPFFVEELVARMNAVARRSVGERQNLVTVGPFKLDRITRTVTCETGSEQQLVELTTREFNLLEYLMRSPGRVFTRTQMLEHVWGYDFNPSTNVVDVCIQRLRKKIEIKGEGRWIESVRGVGYRFRQAE